MFGVKEMARLEIVDTLQKMFRRSVLLYNEDTFCIYIDERGRRREITYRQFGEDVIALGIALKGRRRNLYGRQIGVVGPNSYWWVVTYMAVIDNGGIIVPLDKELTKEELADCLQRVELSKLFYAPTAELNKKINTVKEENTSCEYIPFWQEYEDKASVSVRSLIRDGNKRRARQYGRTVEPPFIQPDACAALLFTSGTTFRSKIVMLSQRAIALSVQHEATPYKVSGRDTFFSILPLHHMLECSTGFFAPMCFGSSIYFSRGVRYTGAELKRERPTFIICVPRLLDVIHNKIWAGLTTRKLTSLVQKILSVLRWCRTDSYGRWLRQRLFWGVYRQFGGKIRIMVCGGAQVDLSTVRNLTQFGFPVYQGYGLTEFSPTVSSTTPDRDDIDSVGWPIQDTTLRIIDPDKKGVGEIVVGGPYIMLGYYNDPGQTEAVLRDGYLYTGDVGYIKPNGALKIVGRKKNVIITSGGKKIYPEEIEALLQKCSVIKEVVVLGEQTRYSQRVCAHIVLHHAGTQAMRELYQNEARSNIQRINDQLAPYERINNIVFRDQVFERTSTQKIKRHKI